MSRQPPEYYDPPRYTIRFLRWFCAPFFLEEIEGDLYEMFQEEVEQFGLRRARRRFFFITLLYIRPYFFGKKQLSPDINHHLQMLHHYLKVSIRQLQKQFFYASINIFGLALGLAACLLVLAYTQLESSFDQTHPNIDRLYRVNQTAIWNPEGGIMASTPPPTAARLAETYPDVEASTRVHTPGVQLVRRANNDGEWLAFNERNVLAADSNFFDFFDFPLQAGDPNTALIGVGKAVLSPEMAQKYFGSGPALGQILEIGEDRLPVEVTGVTYPQAENNHFQFDLLLSMPTFPNVKRFDWSWIWTQMATYIRLKPGMEATVLERKFTELADLYVKPSLSRLGMNFDEFIKDKGGWNFYLQPVRDIHLFSAAIGNRLGTTGSIQIVRLLRVIAILILLIAVLNFINLATARAGTRAKEIGVKKAVGAQRGNLVRQFLLESILVAGMATVLSIGLMQLLQWLIAYFTGIEIDLSIFLQLKWFLVIAALPVLVGLLAGAYPAVYLSAFRSVQVLKGSIAKGVKSPLLRNVLVTAQFTIAIALMAGTVLIYQQLAFIEHKNLGFNYENVLVVNQAEQLGDQMTTFREEVQNLPEVIQASLAMDVPGRSSWEDFYTREGTDIKLSISQNKIDADHFATMGFELAAGRNFDENRPGDLHSVLINETTARLFEWTNDQALGKKILYPGYPGDLQVIGVVQDYHLLSLKQGIMPMIFFDIRNPNIWGDQRVLTIKYTQKNTPELLRKLEQLWSRQTKDIPFEYSFFDEEIAQLYEEERSLSGLISIFAGFSLWIAVIGLIGLLSFSTEQRKKEIGVRKVLGASRLQIFGLLNRQYLFLFLLALFLAVPVSWQSMQNWLNSFVYRIDVNPWSYLLAGSIVILLSFISVSYLSLKIAATNPAEVLKDE